MLRNVISLLLFVAVSGAAQAAPDTNKEQAKPDPKTAQAKIICTATSAAATLDAYNAYSLMTT